MAEPKYAFPRDNQSSQSSQLSGMTLRDYFAAKALQALLPNIAERHELASEGYPTYMTQDLARLCYIIADSMMKVSDE